MESVSWKGSSLGLYPNPVLCTNWLRLLSLLLLLLLFLLLLLLMLVMLLLLLLLAMQLKQYLAARPWLHHLHGNISSNVLRHLAFIPLHAVHIAFRGVLKRPSHRVPTPMHRNIHDFPRPTISDSA